MTRLRLLAATVLLSVCALSSTGCGRGGAGAAIFAGGLIVGSALTAASQEPRHHTSYTHEHVTYVYVNQGPVPNPPTPVRIHTPPAVDDPPAFDAKNARIALAKVDLSPCREAGAPRGYGHAQVTFNPSGDISKVVVDEPSGLSPAAVRCVGDQLGRTTIPEFRGSLVTVGTTFFVP